MIRLDSILTAIKVVVSVTALAVASPAFAQKMYRCGSTYSQTPCGADSKEVEIKGGNGTSGHGSTSFKRLPDNATEEMKSKSLELCKAAVQGRLKDPDSAKFEDVSRSLSVERRIPPPDGPNTKVATVHGYVNAKNSFGGYTGKKMFTCNLDYETESKVVHVYIFD